MDTELQVDLHEYYILQVEIILGILSAAALVSTCGYGLAHQYRSQGSNPETEQGLYGSIKEPWDLERLCPCPSLASV